jgi:hypothetical protein
VLRLLVMIQQMAAIALPTTSQRIVPLRKALTTA